MYIIVLLNLAHVVRVNDHSFTNIHICIISTNFNVLILFLDHFLSLFYGAPHIFTMTPTSNVVIIDPYHDLKFFISLGVMCCYLYLYVYLKLQHTQYKILVP